MVFTKIELRVHHPNGSISHLERWLGVKTKGGGKEIFSTLVRELGLRS